MPIYEYECPECGRFEIVQKITEDALEKCPTCKEAGKDSFVKRLVSASAFHLKGQGWYKTDYGTPSGETLTQTPDKKADFQKAEVTSKPDTKKKSSD